MMTVASTREHKAMLETMAETWESFAADRERKAKQKQRISELDEKPV
jgi:hypothetical protein